MKYRKPDPLRKAKAEGYSKGYYAATKKHIKDREDERKGAFVFYFKGGGTISIEGVTTIPEDELVRAQQWLKFQMITYPNIVEQSSNPMLDSSGIVIEA